MFCYAVRFFYPRRRQNQQIWAILSVILSEVQWNRTGLDIYLFFFVQQFKHVIWLHTCAPAKCYWQKLKLCGLKDCAYGWLVARELHRSLHNTTYCFCHALAPTREVFRVITWTIALSHCPWPLHLHLQQHGGSVNNPQIPVCVGKRTAR